MSGAGGRSELDILSKMGHENIVIRGLHDFDLRFLEHPVVDKELTPDFIAGMRSACRLFVPILVEARRNAIVTKRLALDPEKWDQRTKLAIRSAKFVNDVENMFELEF